MQKNQQPEQPECPNGKIGKFSKRKAHFFVDIKKVPTGKGDYFITEKCKLCGMEKTFQGFYL